MLPPLTLTYRALDLLDVINEDIDLTNLDQYEDINLASDYALESISILVNNELIEGSNKKNKHLSNTTRAEEAVLLYRIYNLK